jgi:hypothetical protein
LIFLFILRYLIDYICGTFSSKEKLGMPREDDCNLEIITIESFINSLGSVISMAEEDLLKKLRNYETYLTKEIDSREEIFKRINRGPFYEGRIQRLQIVGYERSSLLEARAVLYSLFPELKTESNIK